MGKGEKDATQIQYGTRVLRVKVNRANRCIHPKIFPTTMIWKSGTPLVTSTTKTHPPTEPISIWKRKMKTQRIGMVDTLSNAAYNPLTTSRKRPIDD